MTPQVPVVLVSGVGLEPIQALTIGLQWDLPRAVVVQHRIDAERQVLTRMVSDVSGVLEHVEIDLEHACVSCAIREDILPTLERLAETGRWGAIIACLPVTAEAVQVCRVLGYAPGNAPHVRIAATVVALAGDAVVDDLLGDDLVHERGLETSVDDLRGVAEVAAAMVEYADVVTIHGATDDAAVSLVRALVRPSALVVPEGQWLDPQRLLGGLHDHERVEAWVAEVRRGVLPTLVEPPVWQLDLRSDRPFHPKRLRDCIEVIGSGPRRSRGCFWVPSRPGDVCVWDGSGGQLSVGATEHWGQHEPLTRIVVTGIGGDPAVLRAAFESALLTDAELAERGQFWDVTHDGLEPWLGRIARVA